MDGGEGKAGAASRASSWQGLVGTCRVVLHTARDDLLAVREVRREILREAANIDVHVVISLEDKPRSPAVLTRPLDTGQSLQSQILVGIQEVFPDNITVVVASAVRLVSRPGWALSDVPRRKTNLMPCRLCSWLEPQVCLIARRLSPCWRPEVTRTRRATGPARPHTD